MLRTFLGQMSDELGKNPQRDISEKTRRNNKAYSERQPVSS